MPFSTPEEISKGGAPNYLPPPSSTTMTNDSQNQPKTNATVQVAKDVAMSYVPSSLDLAYSFIVGAMAMLGLVLGAQKVARVRRAKTRKRCPYCHGSGEEQKQKKDEPAKCDECDGTGQVEDEDEATIECVHCKGEGEDPCHACKGTGKTRAGQECPVCKGGGLTLTGKQDNHGEDEVADCEICHGEGEVEPTIKKMVTCEKCGGTGSSN